MKAPEHLSHKPIVKVDNYIEIDGKYANNTDAQSISIGKAQYDHNDISAKVWRKEGNKWSRQSEELPIHRVIDLATLAIASAIKLDDEEYPLTNMRESLADARVNEVSEIHDFFKNNEKHLKPRIRNLRELIDRYTEIYGK